MNCKKCGKELPKDVAFCPDCGAPVPLYESKNTADSAYSYNQKTVDSYSSKTNIEEDCYYYGTYQNTDIKPQLKSEQHGSKKPGLWQTFKTSTISFYKDFTSGRCSRKEFWSSFLFFYIAFLIVWAGMAFLAFSLSYFESSTSTSEILVLIIFIIVYLILIVLTPLLCFLELSVLRLMLRRVHDINQPWGMALIPVYNIIVLFLPGTDGPNKYGEKPLN